MCSMAVWHILIDSGLVYFHAQTYIGLPLYFEAMVLITFNVYIDSHNAFDQYGMGTQLRHCLKKYLVYIPVLQYEMDIT